MELRLIGIVLGRLEVSRLFLDHGTRVEVSGTTFFGIEVSRDRCRSVPECLDAEVTGNRQFTNARFSTRSITEHEYGCSVKDGVFLNRDCVSSDQITF